MANSGEVSVVVNSVRGLRPVETGVDAPLKAGNSSPKSGRAALGAPGVEAASAADGTRSGAEGAEGARSPDGEVTRAAVAKVQDFVQVVQRDLKFSVDEDSGRTIVTVLDSDSGEVIRQIPPERILQIAENLEEVNGLLFRGSA